MEDLESLFAVSTLYVKNEKIFADWWLCRRI